MRIGFLYSGGRLRRVEKVAAGTAPTEFFYGSEELRARGHEVPLFEMPEQTKRTLASRVVDRFRAQLPVKFTGELLDQARELAAAVSRCDVLVVAGSGEAFVAEVWRLMGKIECPVVGIHCGLLNVNYSPIRKWTTRFLLNRTWTMLFGDGEFQPMIDFFGLDAGRVFVNQCGIDVHFWTPGEIHGDYVLAVGNDGRRDYELLMKAAARCRQNFVVVTRMAIKEPVPPNVRLVTGDFRQEILSDQELRALFQNARCIVTPLIESRQPSGQSVCLQAMACGRPVILTRTEGLWSKSLRDGENILLVPPYDVEAMVTAIDGVYANPQSAAALGAAGRETVRREWTTDLYAQRLEAFVTTKVLPAEARNGATTKVAPSFSS
ncbi:MAG: glycosyltransferase family 4 protein [Chthoniobacter sp.]|nr:glycosyltransferase family 4 protein [Chthoniobacter sp.]